MIGTVYFSGIELHELLVYFEDVSVSFAINFSHSEGCLFNLIVQKLLNSIKSHLGFFFLFLKLINIF